MKGLVARRPLVSFFVLAFAITWGLDTLRLLLEGTVSRPGGAAPGIVYLVSGAGPSLAGLAVAWAAGGRQGLRVLLRRFLRWRVGVRWYLLVFLAFPALIVGTISATTLLSGGTFRPDFPGPLWLFPALVFYVLLLAGPLPEEIGWRGFALPALMDRYGWLPAGLAVGVAWAFWHRTPMTWTEPLDSAALAGMVSDVSLSVVMAWVYVRTGGSALLAGLGMHLSANLALATATQAVPGLQWTTAGCFVALASLAALDAHRTA